MREAPVYYLLIWRSERTDHVWTETHVGRDDACMAFYEATAIPDGSQIEAPQLIAAAVLVRSASGLRCELIDMTAEVEGWRRDHTDEERARLLEIAAYRGDLF